MMSWSTARRTVTAAGIRVLSALTVPAATAVHAPTAADSASVTAFYGRCFGSAPQGFAAYAAFYALDGYLLPPNAAPVRGREAIAAWMERARSAATHDTRPQGVTVDEMRFVMPTLVAYRSTLRGQRVPKAGGAPVPFECAFISTQPGLADAGGVARSQCRDR